MPNAPARTFNFRRAHPRKSSSRDLNLRDRDGAVMDPTPAHAGSVASAPDNAAQCPSRAEAFSLGRLVSCMRNRY
eukprot:7453155-Pyramimonas_sp.AAC.1